jgi:hypothetical protein
VSKKSDKDAEPIVRNPDGVVDGVDAAGKGNGTKADGFELTKPAEAVLPGLPDLGAEPQAAAQAEAEHQAAAQAPVEISCTRGLADWLLQNQLSLGFTSYQSGRLYLTGVDAEMRVAFHERFFARAMGLWSDT